MEEEIDLRPYIEAIIRRWYWIALGAIVMAALLAGLSFLLPVRYEATALIAILEESERVQFDPRFTDINSAQPLSAYPELANSDQILEELLATTDIARDLDELRDVSTAVPGGDPSILRLIVKDNDPRVAAEVANQWATIFVIRANEIFGNASNTKTLFFENQLENVETELIQIEDELIDFQTRNRVELIANELTLLKNDRTAYLASLNSLALLMNDAETLHNAFQNNGSESLDYANQLASMLIQYRALNTETSINSNEEGSLSVSSNVAIPLAIHIDETNNLIGGTRLEQLNFLNQLTGLLEIKIQQAEAELGEIEPQILDLQRQKQALEIEHNRLVRNQEIAQETYTAVARRLDEERITSQDIISGVKLASQASIPTRSENFSLPLFVIAGIAFGAGLVTIFLIWRKWWQSYQTEQE